MDRGEDVSGNRTFIMVSTNVVDGLQVSGLECFEGQRWREAILSYLEGIWADRGNVTYRPKIYFGNVTLRLDPSTARYYAYGETSGPPPMSQDGQKLTVGNDQVEVEQALVRFVKNDHIRELTISLANHGTMRLVKGRKRSELRVWVQRIPRTLLDI